MTFSAPLRLVRNGTSYILGSAKVVNNTQCMVYVYGGAKEVETEKKRDIRKEKHLLDYVVAG